MSGSGGRSGPSPWTELPPAARALILSVLSAGAALAVTAGWHLEPAGLDGTTLLFALRRTGGRYGLATLCVGVGQGVATIVERIDD